MGEDSKISWTHHTWNPWVGCTKVSAGCTNCYAEALSKRTGLAVWGDVGTRRVTTDTYWKQPYKWARDAAALGERKRVFCASLADVLEDKRELDDPRKRMWDVIEVTRYALDWLILTKRPENFGMIPENLAKYLWLGTSVEDQEAADKRIPFLEQATAAIRFLSAEPLLSELDLEWPATTYPKGPPMCCSGRECGCQGLPVDPPLIWKIDWVIAGGESGPKARPCAVAWIRSLVAQCRKYNTACFVKQLGSKPTGDWGIDIPISAVTHAHKGEDVNEWPHDIRVREMPEVKF